MYGYHEGYLVTPISTGTLVTGNVLAGAIVASLAGMLVLGAVLAPDPGHGGRRPGRRRRRRDRLPDRRSPSRRSGSCCSRAPAASSVLRGMFGIINALLFFPSGALYPVESYPPWLQAISRVDPADLRLERAARPGAARQPARGRLRGLGLPPDLRAGVRHPDARPVPARDLGGLPALTLTLTHPLPASAGSDGGRNVREEARRESSLRRLLVVAALLEEGGELAKNFFRSGLSVGAEQPVPAFRRAPEQGLVGEVGGQDAAHLVSRRVLRRELLEGLPALRGVLLDEGGVVARDVDETAVRVNCQTCGGRREAACDVKAVSNRSSPVTNSSFLSPSRSSRR